MADKASKTKAGTRLSMNEIAAKILEHLQTLEADTNWNQPNPDSKVAIPKLFHSGAYSTGKRIQIKYVSFQNWNSLTRKEALQYLEWLDAGNKGTHYVMLHSAST